MPPTYKDYTFDYLDNNTPSTPSPIIDNANVPDHTHVPVPEYAAHQKIPNINPPTLNPSYLNTSPITSQQHIPIPMTADISIRKSTRV